MAKLSKTETERHFKACELLKKDVLTDDEKDFVFDNWFEFATHMNGVAGAFFTPLDLAFDMALDIGPGRIIDLCAGIGVLSYAAKHRNDLGKVDLTCVEINPAYVEVGKKLVPEAKWINASIFDIMDMDLGHFDYAISNPPFGNIKHDGHAPRYKGKKFEFSVIDIASQIADYGVFILPQMSAGFKYSGNQYFQRIKDDAAFKFQKDFGMRFDGGVGVDTSLYLKSWKGVSPLCEIVCVDFIND